MFPKTANPLVIRTDFENQQAWDAICGLIRAPVQEGSDTFLAFVEFLEATEYRNISTDELLQTLPPDVASHHSPITTEHRLKNHK
jgi:hypothetical protein